MATGEEGEHSGVPFYYNEELGESTWEHPLDQFYKEKFERLKAEKKRSQGLSDGGAGGLKRENSKELDYGSQRRDYEEEDDHGEDHLRREPSRYGDGHHRDDSRNQRDVGRDRGSSVGGGGSRRGHDDDDLDIEEIDDFDIDNKPSPPSTTSNRQQQQQQQQQQQLQHQPSRGSGEVRRAGSWADEGPNRRYGSSSGGGGMGYDDDDDNGKSYGQPQQQSRGRDAQGSSPTSELSTSIPSKGASSMVRKGESVDEVRGQAVRRQAVYSPDYDEDYYDVPDRRLSNSYGGRRESRAERERGVSSSYDRNGREEGGGGGGGFVIIIITRAQEA